MDLYFKSNVVAKVKCHVTNTMVKLTTCLMMNCVALCCNKPKGLISQRVGTSPTKKLKALS